ncbi:MAG: DUF1570 domain-containing protein [Gemmataceae bacterium]
MTHLPAALVLLSLAAVGAGLPNLDLADGTVTDWDGDRLPVSRIPATDLFAASTAESATGKAILHRTFIVPATAHHLTFRAAVTRPAGIPVAGTLDVVLEAAGRELLPREGRDGERWASAPSLPADGSWREYRWDVTGHAGRRVRIAIVDGDDRPGCFVAAGGFRLVSRDEVNLERFGADLRRLQQKHGLGRFTRQESRHFLALTSADRDYTEYRLGNCETLYAAFFPHFRKRGFVLTPPAEKLQVAIFDAPAGLEAYLDHPLASAVTGIYHPASNRLLVYDYARNRDYLDTRSRADTLVRGGPTDLERQNRMVTLGRRLRDFRDDTNISTMMHEVAHQLSFNTGLLNRHGDHPAWAVEGLAVYCEPTARGLWQGIGEANPSRAAQLADPARGRGTYLPLLRLVRDDRWLTKAATERQILLGYAQSGALFRLLMEERPNQLRRYLETIFARRTPEHRLADFTAAFGDLARLEQRYQAYLGEIARKEAR